jgi:DNA sulfur modification protein DndB
MAEVLNGLVSGEALKPIYLQRSKSADEKTIGASNKEALALKIAAEEADGWRIVHRNKKSIRVAKDKPTD